MSNTKVKIWASDYIQRTELFRKIDIKLNIEEPSTKDFIDYQDKYEAGTAVSPEDSPIYPIAMYFRYYDIPESYKKKWRDFFRVQLGLVVVSGRMRDLLLQFNLGDTSFRELPLYENDQVTPRPEGPFYLMHVRQFRDAFVPEKSEGVEKYKTVEKWQPAGFASDVLAVNANVVGDADLWMDRNISCRVFFSDRLRQAIKLAKFQTYGLSFKHCRISNTNVTKRGCARGA